MIIVTLIVTIILWLIFLTIAAFNSKLKVHVKETIESIFYNDAEGAYVFFFAISWFLVAGLILAPLITVPTLILIALIVYLVRKIHE